MVERPPKMKYCTKCVYPASSAVPLAFDENGVCSGCRVHEQKMKIDWGERGKLLKKIADQYRSKNGSQYDCIIPVSGGKDSYFQTWYITEVLKLKPLLVTYHGNDYLDCATRNLQRMRKVFKVDHLIFGPDISLLKKLHKKCFKLMGDMSWHNHCGILTFPVQVAVKFNIPLIIWGEHGFTDYGGMYNMNDLVEMTKKYRTEHGCRGYDWHDMIDPEMGITEQDVLWAKYPTDEELEEKDIRGLYLGFYVFWDANKHAKKMMEEWGFEQADVPFERTYRMISALDDMHENGIHDYMKFIKFGYGRATDHSCKDIRLGYMTREEGMAMVKKYDTVKPYRDFTRWLEYVGMTEEEFDKIADTFRDSRVWWKDENGNWVKDNLWDGEVQPETPVVSKETSFNEE
jgi:N-acetyl sugar amidotransferase